MQIKKSQIQKRKKPSLDALRKRAVREAWKKEKERILQGKGTRDWTPKQQREILQRGSARGYQGHHMISVCISRRQAGNPDNIQFLTWKEHFFGAHGGSFSKPSNGFYDTATGKMHPFSDGKILSPPVRALSTISPALAKAIRQQNASSAGNKQGKAASEGSTKKITNRGGMSGGTGMINVDEQKYEDMIEALNKFVQDMDEHVGTMMTLVQNCCSIMDGDEAVSKAASKVRQAEKAYLEGAKQAASISNAMNEELTEYRRIKAEAAADD